MWLHHRVVDSTRLTNAFTSDAHELLKKMLQVMLEDMDDLRSDIKEKDELIEQLLQDEQEKDDWDEIERKKDEWFGDD